MRYRRKSALFYKFYDFQNVAIVFSEITDRIHQRTDKKNPHAAFFRMVEIRNGHRFQIETLAVVVDPDVQFILFNVNSNPDLVFGVVVIGVFDGV
jgi:hypothetical protein